MNKSLNILLVFILLGFVGYNFYKSPKYNNGQLAPDIEATLKSGEQFKLSDLKGSYVLLDFWGSWCGPCRKDNKNLVKLYDKYNTKAFNNGKGFEIVSVGIETSEVQWERAIEKDKLFWPYHIVQLDRFNSPIARQYGIKEIPTKYLISPEGKILGSNYNYEKTSAILDQNLK